MRLWQRLKDNDTAQDNSAYLHLKRIAQLGAKTPAQQRCLMLPLHFTGDQVAYRMYQKGDVHQIALVLLDKGDRPADFTISDDLQPGHWKATFGDSAIDVANGNSLHAHVDAHDVQVYLLDAAASRSDLVDELTRLMQERGHLAN